MRQISFGKLVCLHFIIASLDLWSCFLWICFGSKWPFCVEGGGGRKTQLKPNSFGYVTIFFNFITFSVYGALANQDLTCGLHVGHTNIALYYFTPSKSFSGIRSGQTFSCIYYNKLWTASRSDHMPNWYVTSLGMKPKIIESTQDEDISFVGDFNKPEKWKRAQEDQYNPYTPYMRYLKHERKNATYRQFRVVPNLFEVIEDPTSILEYDSIKWKVLQSNDFEFESSYLAGMYLPFNHLQMQ